MKKILVTIVVLWAVANPGVIPGLVVLFMIYWIAKAIFSLFGGRDYGGAPYGGRSGFLDGLIFRIFRKKKYTSDFLNYCRTICISDIDRLSLRISREEARFDGELAYRDLCIREFVDAYVATIVGRHESVLSRKKRIGSSVNDYGIADQRRWLKECDYFVREVLLPIPVDGSWVGDVELEFIDYVNSGSRDAIDLLVGYVDGLISDDGDTLLLESDRDVSDGFEYEYFVAKIFERLGWSARVTPGSGDQGADVVCEGGGSRIAVQCKYYTSDVGNGAVQEVFSAKKFYECDYACVITNSGFTRSAKQLAQKLDVRLLGNHPFNLQRV